MHSKLGLATSWALWRGTPLSEISAVASLLTITAKFYISSGACDILQLLQASRSPTTLRGFGAATLMEATMRAFETG